MKKFLVAAFLLAFFLVLPLASAGYVDINADFSGGSVTFYQYHSTAKGSIYQEYTSSGASGSATYQTGYDNGILTIYSIDAQGSGAFKTILDPKPSYSWTANAAFYIDGAANPVSDSGSDTIFKIFEHTWSSSFIGSGFYSIN